MIKVTFKLSFFLFFFHLLHVSAVSNLCLLYHYFKMQIDGNRPKEVVFNEIDSLLSQVQEDKIKLIKSGKCFQVLKCSI